MAAQNTKLSLRTKQELRSFLTIHKGCVFPGRFRHTSYPYQRIDADCSINAPTPSILLVSRQITSEALHIIRLKYSKPIVIDYPIATLVIDEKMLLNFSNVTMRISFGNEEEWLSRSWSGELDVLFIPLMKSSCLEDLRIGLEPMAEGATLNKRQWNFAQIRARHIDQMVCHTILLLNSCWPGTTNLLNHIQTEKFGAKFNASVYVRGDLLEGILEKIDRIRHSSPWTCCNELI